MRRKFTPDDNILDDGSEPLENSHKDTHGRDFEDDEEDGY